MSASTDTKPVTDAGPDGEAKADIVRILLSILLPPVGVALQVGFSLHFWLNILLTLLGYVPGIIHAVWIILSRR